MRKSQALRGRRPPGPPIAGSAPGLHADWIYRVAQKIGTIIFRTP